MSHEAARRLLDAAGFREAELRPLGGGDIGAAYRASTPSGDAFVKVARAGFETDFGAEAAGLRHIRAASSILRIPEVLAVGEEGLVLEFVDRGRPGPDYDARLAEGLAEMHEATAEAYGFERTTYCGATPQPNPWTNSWVEFYVEHRIRHQIRSLEKRGRIQSGEEARLSAWADGLSDRLAEPERPALMHGDLWSGNILCDGEGRPVILDPAAYFGCAEAELGMLTWMGGRSRRFYEVYVEAAHLPADWQTRADAYRAYHVMNHATLFGGPYLNEALSMADK
jgi:protein-ribulosamine 3-kinase